MAGFFNNRTPSIMTRKIALKLHDDDNVAVCTSEVTPGDVVALISPDGAETEITARAAIAFCNKIALVDIAAGEEILKYGESIGRTTAAIPQGGLADHHNIESQPRAYADEYVLKGE